jgi:hypothetical protein
MSDESRHPGRPLRAEEKALLAALLGSSLDAIDERLKFDVVEDMSDGGMGSIRFLHESGEPRSFGKAIAEAECDDADGVTVSIVVNVDDRGDLYEIDFWKVDFSPMRDYPTPERLRMKAKARL